MKIKNQKLYFFHNFNCSKSKEVKNFLDKKKVSYHIIDYMKSKIDKNLLKKTIESLDNDLNEIIRTKEDVFKELNYDQRNLNKEIIYYTIVKYPLLLQRPIIVKVKSNKIIKSLICRPPKLIENFFN